MFTSTVNSSQSIWVPVRAKYSHPMEVTWGGVRTLDIFRFFPVNLHCFYPPLTLTLLSFVSGHGDKKYCSCQTTERERERETERVRGRSVCDREGGEVGGGEIKLAKTIKGVNSQWEATDEGSREAVKDSFWLSDHHAFGRYIKRPSTSSKRTQRKQTHKQINKQKRERER